MSFFNAIATLKGALLGALLGNQLPGKSYHSATQHRPGYGKPCHHHPHSDHFDYSHPQPARPGPYNPHPQLGGEYPLPSRPLYPFFSLNR